MNQDTDNYDLGWQSLSSTPLTNLISFKYSNSSVYNSYPYAGVFSSYVGGGFTYELTGNATQIQADFQVMQQNNWIDRQTRAVFLEYSLFNSNINLLPRIASSCLSSADWNYCKLIPFRSDQFVESSTKCLFVQFNHIDRIHVHCLCGVFE